jgi:hypothetical protein
MQRISLLQEVWILQAAGQTLLTQTRPPEGRTDELWRARTRRRDEPEHTAQEARRRDQEARRDQETAAFRPLECSSLDKPYDRCCGQREG